MWQDPGNRPGEVEYPDITLEINSASQAADAFLQFAQTVNEIAAQVQERSNRANLRIQENLSSALELIRLEKENALNEIRRERASNNARREGYNIGSGNYTLTE